MTAPDDARTLLSVRAQARRTVAPDSALIHISVAAIADESAGALDEVTTALAGVSADLVAAGGEVQTADNERAPLTWSVHGMHTHPWHDDDQKQRGIRRHRASIELQITVRQFTLLAAVEALAMRYETVVVNGVGWHVDDDNAAWPLVRADAITAALVKGQDYAAALGGTVLSVEHIADAGLLGGERSGFIAQAEQESFRRLSGRSSDESTLTPVPQVVTAVIDARLTATRGPLPTR